jgi:nicotinamidase-related amidase
MERRDSVLERIAFLVEVGTIVGMPTIVTRQYPKGLGELCEPTRIALEAAERSGSAAAHVDKLAFNCFLAPEFVSALEATGRRQLILCGMESHICVAQTALAGLGQSYDVHVVDDACCSRDERAHDSALARLRHAGAVVTVSESTAYELVGKAGTPEFKRLLAAVKGS